MARPVSMIWSQKSKFMRCAHQVLRRRASGLLYESNVAAFSISSSQRSKQEMDDSCDNIGGNPFFDKYKQKIQHMQNTNPEEFSERLRDLAESRNRKPLISDVDPKAKQHAMEVTPPSEVAKAGAGMTRPKGLESVMKIDLIRDKTAKEITQIWNQYHSDKDVLYTTLQKKEYENLYEKSKECPVFVFPIPRADGFEFILAQFDRHDVYFTPLAMFQLVRENAPPCLTVNHFTELIDDKEIVLMSGQYDDKVLSKTLALSLVQQMSTFYGRESKYYELVRKFNYEPSNFQYEELIDVLKTLPQYDLR